MSGANFAYLSLSIALAVLNGGILHHWGDRELKNSGDILLFNGGISAIWFVMVMLLGGIPKRPSWETIGLGAGYGVVIAGFLLSKMQALATGNMSVTLMVGSCSMVLPTILGSLIWHEAVSVWQGAGLVFLIIAMGLSVRRSKGQSGGLRWKGYCVLFFVFSGLSGFLFKVQQNSAVSEQVAEFVWIAAIVSAAGLTAAAFMKNRLEHAPCPRISRAAWKPMIFCGICSCAYNWINILLAGRMPSAMFFPLFNGCVILGGVAVSHFAFGESLSGRQMFALGLGVVSMIIVGIGG